MPHEVGVGWTVTHFQLNLGLAPFEIGLGIVFYTHLSSSLEYLGFSFL